MIAREVFYEQLSVLDLKIEMADSGEKAIDLVEQGIKEDNTFEIVISDFHMPEMDGEMLAAEIKRKKLLQPGALIFVTSSPRKGDGSRLKDLGFDGYLTKPTRALEVSQIISLVWKSKLRGDDIPLVTGHMLREVKTGDSKVLKLKSTHVLLVRITR